MKRYWLGLAVLAGMIGVAGCGGGYSKVEGVVQDEDGKPIEKATVVFMPVDQSGTSANGFTDAQGRFTLTTGNVEGAKKGKYKVTITKIKDLGDKPMDPTSAEAKKAMMKGVGKAGGGGGAVIMPGKPGPQKGAGESELAGEYGSPDTTPFTEEVPPKGTLTFKVKYKKGKK